MLKQFAEEENTEFDPFDPPALPCRLQPLRALFSTSLLLHLPELDGHGLPGLRQSEKEERPD